MSEPNLIEAAGLTKSFGDILAVDHVDFTVRRGEVLGFLGPNGAGKTTTMRMLTGYLAASAGKARIAGYDIEAQPREAKAKIGYLPEGAPLYDEMIVLDFLDFTARMRGLTGSEAEEAVDMAIERLGLAPVAYQRIDTLSKGFKRRVGLAQALLHDPEVLILDEPTDGLDPNQKFEVRQLIRDMAKDKAIIISTHILEEVDAVCNRAMIIAKGRIVVDTTPRELIAMSRNHNAVTLAVKAADAQRITAIFEGAKGIASVETLAVDTDQIRLNLVPHGGKPIISSVGEVIRREDIAFDALEVHQGRLEDVFRHLTGMAAPGTDAVVFEQDEADEETEEPQNA